jgi:transglutaminase-like putative cysteine protease
MKETAFIFAAALAALCRAADGVTPENYPDADTVVVDSRTETVYQADGTFVKTEEDWVKALTERGRRQLSTVSVDYSLRYGRGEILLVEIIDAEGNARQVDFRGTLKEATDNSSVSDNIYDPLDKTLTCAVPGLAVGETRHVVRRSETTRSRIRDQWADIELFQSMQPVLHSSVRIDAPLSRPLRSVALRNPIGNVASSAETNGTRIAYRWECADSPQMFPEPAMPPFWTLAQNLRVSTAGSWQEISRWYWDVSLPHLEKTNSAMTNKVAEIMFGLGEGASAMDRIRAVYKFVSQEIRYMGLTLEDTSPGYTPHDVCVTFDGRYGVCRDKAALLAAMLRIAGFEAFPALINAGRAKMDPEVPSPFFNHAVAAVRLPARGAAPDVCPYVLMDPTDESSRDLMPAYLSDCSYLVATPEGDCLRTSPVVPPEENSVVVSGRGRLGRDGSLVVDYSVAFRGVNDNTYRQNLLSMKAEKRREFFEKIVAGAASGAELLRCAIAPGDLQDTSSELRADLLVRFPEALLRGETLDAVSVPALSASLGAANWVLEGRTALESRKYPLRLSSTASSEERLEIDLGGVVGETASLPEDESFGGAYAFTRTFRREGDALAFERRLSVGAVEFSPDGYTELRERAKRVEAAGRAVPLFAKDVLSGANERILSRVVTYDLSDGGSWVCTNTVVKEILTYKGKKSASELKFPFNPTWKEVELVSAVVSNANGTVVRAGEREMNVLDADWVSAAPRYPASKVLVVNLPSVEVGSVISYTVVTTVRDAPVPFYANFFFDTFVPTDFLSVRVDDWRREVGNPRLLRDEPMLPAGTMWRDVVGFSRGDFASAAEKYRALDPEPLDPDEAIGEWKTENGKWKTGKGLEGVVAIRNWMARHVRRTGPGFGEIRLEDHVVDPKTVVRERYATRIGYVRTLCALLKGAGYDADVVFAGATAQTAPEVLERDIYAVPNIARFPFACCRVKVRTGGFLWWGGETATYLLGTENEYTPPGATEFEGSLYLDPENGCIAAVPSAWDLRERTFERLEFGVRPNGSVDLDYRMERCGASVGSSRKRFAEMLPEMRSRTFQRMLGYISQSASATRELQTDTEGYPFVLSFSAYVPDMAVVSGDAISLELPQLAEQPFSLTGTMRENPIGVGGTETEESSVYVVRFPAGYTEIEHLPAEIVVRNPARPDEVWLCSAVNSCVEGDAAKVEIEVVHRPRRDALLPPEHLAMLKEWDRRAGSKANSTIVVRRRR